MKKTQQQSPVPVAVLGIAVFAGRALPGYSGAGESAQCLCDSGAYLVPAANGLGK